MKNAINTARVEELKRKYIIKKIKSFIPSNFVLGSITALMAMFWVFAYTMTQSIDANVEICKQLTPEQNCYEHLSDEEYLEVSMKEQMERQAEYEWEQQEIIKRIGE